LVVPLLTDAAEGAGFAESFEFEFADGTHAFDEGGEGVDDGGGGDGLLVLGEGGGTLGVSLRMPFLALVTGLDSCLGKRTSLMR